MKEDRTTKETEKTTEQPQESARSVADWEAEQEALRNRDTENGPDRYSRPIFLPSSPTCIQHPTGCPTGCTRGQMHIRIHELMCLVAQLAEEMLLLETADKVGPEQWSSAALTLREVANRSLLLRQRCLALAAEALGLDHQTSGTLGLFEEPLPPK